MRAVLLLVACASHPAVVHDRAIDWASVDDQTSAMRAWRRLAPTGASEARVLAMIPEAARGPMAFALVRDGHFTCERRGNACSEDEATARPHDVFDSPCVREDLIDALLGHVMPMPALPDDVAHAIARSDAARLVLDIGGMLDGDAQLAFLADAEGTDTMGVSEWLLHAAPPDRVARAVGVYHLDGAVSQLDPSQREVAIAALGDDHLGDWAKDAAIDDVDENPDRSADPELVSALIALAASPSCRVAHDAVTLLAELGHPEYLPERPLTTDPAVMVRGLCVLGASYAFDERETALFASYLAGSGLVVDLPEGDPIGNDPTPAQRRFARNDPSLGNADDFLGQDCVGTVCVTDGDTFHYRFVVDADRTLRLAEIEIDRDLAAEARPPRDCERSLR